MIGAECKHDLCENIAGKGYCINTMTDWIPVKYCPECGVELNNEM